MVKVNNTLDNIYKLDTGSQIRYSCLESTTPKQITIISKYIVAIKLADISTYNNESNTKPVELTVIQSNKFPTQLINGRIKNYMYRGDVSTVTAFKYGTISKQYVILSYGVYGVTNDTSKKFISIPDVRLYNWGEIRSGGRRTRKRTTKKK